ncbi:MAG: diguanylate cyclase [Phycisphaerae bacterium]|nr:diguanylate cyclase [Phycisphaerae bacterium]
MTESAKTQIIIVEDEFATRKLIQRQLERAGYRVIACGDGRAALEPISKMGSGIVLADWSMPEMDGLELCRTIRELERMQALTHIYFILLTAHNSKEQVIEGLKAGADDYLTKPYHAGELLARIQVGQRILRLQEELLQRNIEYQKANTQLALLTRKLEELANTDGLTGLASRRFLFERFNEVWDLAERYGHPFGCLMLDVDKFKKVNDTYGHDAGDAVLKEVARIIRETGRRPDMCGRIGGEEFVVLCPETARDGLVALAERIRQNVAAHTIVCDDIQIKVSISCGVAEKTPATPSPEELLKNADAMLYAAKGNGRNQTWVATGTGSGEPVAAAEPPSCYNPPYANSDNQR